MAYTKIFPIRTRLDRRVRYALNGKKTALEAAAGYALDAAKTESVLFTDAFNCGLTAPCTEMYATKRRWGKDQNRVQGYHIIQSFRPGEVTPEQAHEIGCEFVRRFLAGRYETVIGTHLDKAHPHNHIVFNACSYADGRMFRNDFNNYYNGIRTVSDALCREYGLSVIEPQNKGKQYREWLDEKEKKPTMRGMVKADVDEVLAAAVSFQTFVLGLQRRGYIVKYGPEIKYMAVRHKTGGKFLRLKSLGPEYTEAAIRQRLEQPPQLRTPTTPEVSPRPARQNMRKKENQKPSSRPRRAYRLRGRFASGRAGYSGFAALTYRYLHLLCKVRRKRAPRHVSYALRGELRRFDRYLAQHQFLLEHKITDSAALCAYRAQTKTEIERMTHRRAALYRKRGDSSNGMNRAELSAQIDRLTSALRAMRRELRLCEQIEADMENIRDQLALAHTDAQREETKKRKEVKRDEYGR